MSKKPTVLIEGSCSAEQVVDGVNGFTVKENEQLFAQKLQYICNNSKEVKEVGEKAYKTLYRSWDTVCDEVLENYKKVIQNYKSKRENNAK